MAKNVLYYLKLVLCWLALMGVVGFCHMQLSRVQNDKEQDQGSWPPPGPGPDLHSHSAIEAQARLDNTVEALRLCSGGYNRLLADFLWLSFIQYAGDKKLQQVVAPDGSQYPLSYSYVYLITQLDPTFLQPYWFGCWNIGYWQKRPDLADRVCRWGIDNNPQEWHLPFLAGVNQYLWIRRSIKDWPDSAQKREAEETALQAAARYYRQAAKLPQAPAYLERHARILEANIPEDAKEIRTLESVYRSADDFRVKEDSRQRLIQLWTGILKKAPADAPAMHIVASQNLIALWNDLYEAAADEDARKNARGQLISFWNQIYTFTSKPAEKSQALEELHQLGAQPQPAAR